MTQAAPPTVQRAGEPPERCAETPPLAISWRIQRNRSLCPLALITCGYLERSTAQWRTVLLPAVAALQDGLTRPGLPLRVGRVSLAKTVSSNFLRMIRRPPRL